MLEFIATFDDDKEALAANPKGGREPSA